VGNLPDEACGAPGLCKTWSRIHRLRSRHGEECRSRGSSAHVPSPSDACTGRPPVLAAPVPAGCVRRDGAHGSAIGAGDGRRSLGVASLTATDRRPCVRRARPGLATRSSGGGSGRPGRRTGIGDRPRTGRLRRPDRRTGHRRGRPRFAALDLPAGCAPGPGRSPGRGGRSDRVARGDRVALPARGLPASRITPGRGVRRSVVLVRAAPGSAAPARELAAFAVADPTSSGGIPGRWWLGHGRRHARPTGAGIADAGFGAERGQARGCACSYTRRNRSDEMCV
jgi:hypothetical protein